MMKQLLKQIYNERRSNAFLWIELLLAVSYTHLTLPTICSV